MKLDTLTFSGTISGVKRTKKITVYEYLWTDANAVEEAGLGVRSFTVSGVLSGSSDRDALEQACESAGVKNLYFASIVGATDDRYYKVQTHPCVFEPITATVYSYSFECICADGALYDSATDTAVW